MPATPPRLYVIPATRAPLALVFRHGPAKWWMLAQWDLARDTLTPGAWFRGTLYPRRCDLSPDGRLLYYFALKGSTGGWMGSKGVVAFSAVSKAPWLRALVAWRELGTYTRGYHFVEGAGPAARPWEIGPPQHGDAAPLRARWGLARTSVEQFAVETRRGWSAHEGCPPRDPHDMWDQKRRSVLVKPRPHRDGRLVITDRGYERERPGATEGVLPAYRWEKGRRAATLEDAVWADWDARGRLLVATLSGRLQVRDVDSKELAVVWEHDLSAYRVSPRAAPAEAQRW